MNYLTSDRNALLAVLGRFAGQHVMMLGDSRRRRVPLWRDNARLP